ncbi:oxygen-insensitive NADPH nitroreductase [Bacillus gobiensis]|uniref:oxygen-insensitive NADPH nitroreductase n=1 Tax=Bacillus gobiensis TaxID=1441095 RepID=UPI003D2135DF
MNQIIETILDHRSVRSFTQERLTAEEIKLLVEAAQAASTSSYIQAYSIIGVSDHKLKEKLADYAGNQSYVAENGHFFVFCADLHRHEQMAYEKGVDIKATIESTEAFMIAVIDAALAAQNLAIAAESMGLGICYIGGIRNHLKEVSEILETPEYVLPLFGMAVGHPAQQTDKKPRLPLQSVYHENKYDGESAIAKLAEYDETISSYYRARTDGIRTETWTDQITNRLRHPKRTFMKEFVEEKGFSKR